MEAPLREPLSACMAADSPIAAFIDHEALRALPRRENHQLLWTMMTLDGVLRQSHALVL